MKIAACRPTRPRRAFTLIELLVVISIIGVLAALVLSLAGPAEVKQRIKLTQAELAQLQTAMEQYKAATGFYPPDNPGNPAVNQLYYELAGTTYDPTSAVYQTLDGTAKINAADLQATFGVNGFMNCTKGDVPAKSCVGALRQNQIGRVTIGGVAVSLLVSPLGWPANAPAPPLPAQAGINPWRYVSSNPTHNVGTYDLWIDLFLRGKTYRISNWSQSPQVF